MTIREIVEKIDSFSDEERGRYLALLYKNLTLPSQSHMLNFQSTWDCNKSFDEFKKAQSVELRRCIEIELSEMGEIVRKAAGLQPLNEDDEIREPGYDEALLRMSVAMDAGKITFWDATIALAILFDRTKEKAADGLAVMRSTAGVVAILKEEP